jgi:hypothetical protein
MLFALCALRYFVMANFLMDATALFSLEIEFHLRVFFLNDPLD